MSASDEPASGAAPRWLKDLGAAAHAVRELAQAERELLGAELRLARSAASTLLLAVAVAATLAGALVFTLLALVAFALAQWLGWWVWALLVLAGFLAAGLLVAIVFARRCLHWLSLPGTRAQWHSLTSRSHNAPHDKREADDGAASPDR